MHHPPLSATEWERWLIQWLASELKLSPQEIRNDESLLNYGMDSVNAIMLVGDLEDRLGGKLPPTLVWDFPTIDGLVGKLVAESAAMVSDGSVAPTSGQAKPDAMPVGMDAAQAQELLQRLDELSDQEVEALLERLKQG